MASHHPKPSSQSPSPKKTESTESPFPKLELPAKSAGDNDWHLWTVASRVKTSVSAKVPDETAPENPENTSAEKDGGAANNDIDLNEDDLINFSDEEIERYGQFDDPVQSKDSNPVGTNEEVPE
ncbi:hypothetical protein A1O1_06685 [Capronia coronata CBS 617.96]|uniref:Uncharacterized protein n=1 Tax=Capronia coronata CBS 617.96 TaxID=1182541 RepID=W9XR90_9EURO|nr:uncharacterized protein A1O1_06685 [Capronia coronata CBS 617.96]EXJ83067.1 hypothetical protein A1O1_06685 [Capronia coronata CBS 617.96]